MRSIDSGYLLDGDVVFECRVRGGSVEVLETVPVKGDGAFFASEVLYLNFIFYRLPIRARNRWDWNNIIVRLGAVSGKSEVVKRSGDSINSGDSHRGVRCVYAEWSGASTGWEFAECSVVLVIYPRIRFVMKESSLSVSVLSRCLVNVP